MTGEALRREDALHARTSGFRNRVARAETETATVLAEFAAPWVAFSGGKDSLVALALAARARPETTALWTDDELEYPEQSGYIPAACAALGARLVVKTGTQMHDGWFTPWTDAPFWREPGAETIVTRERAWQVRERLGGDVTVLGTRKAESRARRIGLSRWGALHETRDRGWHAHPLANWLTADVWAAIAAWGLPYNPVYDVLARVGVPRDLQRVGPLPLSPGWVLRAGWPADYRRLVERYGARWG